MSENVKKLNGQKFEEIAVGVVSEMAEVFNKYISKI